MLLPHLSQGVQGGPRPGLLLLDTFSAHKCADVRMWCAAHGVALVMVPGGCTGEAQPIDVGVNAVIKKAVADKWLSLVTASTTPRIPVPDREQLSSWLEVAWASLTPETIVEVSSPYPTFHPISLTLCCNSTISFKTFDKIGITGPLGNAPANLAALRLAVGEPLITEIDSDSGGEEPPPPPPPVKPVTPAAAAAPSMRATVSSPPLHESEPDSDFSSVSSCGDEDSIFDDARSDGCFSDDDPNEFLHWMGSGEKGLALHPVGPLNTAPLPPATTPPELD